MRTLRIASITLLALVPTVLIFAGPGRLSGRARNLQTGRIVGLVLDANDARIVGATVRIENARFNRKLRSSDKGDFEVELPAGTYRIIVEKDGFKGFEISSFHLNADACETVNIYMEVKPPEMPLKIEITESLKSEFPAASC